MATAAEISSNPHLTSLALNIQEDDDPKMMSDESTESNWQKYNQKHEQQEPELQESHQDYYKQDIDNDRPSTPSDRSQTPDYRPESTGDLERADTPDSAGNRSQTPDYRPESPGESQRADTPDSAGDAASFDDDKETDDYYDQAAQQQLLQQELQKLKDEGILPQSDEPVFDYDIAERVKQLNAELEQEESTPEKKNRRVIFSDNLVEFSPSPDFSGEDGKVSRTEDQTDPNDLEVAKLNLNDDDEEENRQRLHGKDGGGDISASGNSDASDLPNGNHQLDRLTNGDRHNLNGASGGADESDQPDGNSQYMQQQSDEQHEQVLLERNGKFELVNVKDLSAEERFMMGLEPAKDQNSNNSAHSSSGAVAFQPSPPPRKQRPSTATGQGAVQRQQLAPRRIQSAKTHREVNGAEGHVSYSTFEWDARSSGYGMTPEQKAAMRKAYRLQLQHQKEEQEQREEEKQRAKEESEKAFQWWVDKKREEDKQKRKEEKERRKKEQEEKEFKDPESVFQAWVEKKNKLMKEERRMKAEEERIKSQEQESEAQDPESTYKAWLENKKEQAKLDKTVRRKMEEEKDRAFYVRDRKDCDKAFKEWLRSKNSQLKEDRSMKRTAASHTQKKAKLSRKSRQLAKALQIAEAYSDVVETYKNETETFTSETETKTKTSRP
ncbi:uncharacterized protein [Amphiura filiformis]|uniref:uncharacterized protein isoform X2 n=1 Tax=Amphiura filiformis TaxID=82378 RepID=UPI003B21BD68